MTRMRSDLATWYARIAVFLPLLVPGCVCLLHLVGVVGPSFTLGISVGSILLAGIPYAAFAIVGLVYLWDCPLTDYLRWSIRAPLIFPPIFAAFLVWSQFLGRVRSLLEIGDMLLITAPIVLVVGYAYVGVFYVGFRVLCRGRANGVIFNAES